MQIWMFNKYVINHLLEAVWNVFTIKDLSQCFVPLKVYDNISPAGPILALNGLDRVFEHLTLIVRLLQKLLTHRVDKINDLLLQRRVFVL